ncbi:thioesterase-like superfamily-domain-containing protein [Dactylonectria estremocensis]|uniref:Thioesterase-like superfamily-domain-containing protein n=1 Tax=Dactylonectria estremocensis TaxID=1079267 RepID=A0A9P9IY67_9HYPO|nr:thioesterase-like superfamily-domain-containing protein [Dactylonectria estremocensis]
MRIPQTLCRAVPSLRLSAPVASGATRTIRQFHSTRPARKSHNPRWLSDVKARLKRCQDLDIAPERMKKSKELFAYIQSHWLELLAGEEGYLTAKEWRGLDNHQVTWGDMVSPVQFPTVDETPHWLRHVNNVVYNKYAEAARVNFLRSFVATSDPEHRQEWIELMTPRSVGLILRSIRTDYKFPMDFPDRTTVLHKLVSPPNYDSDHVLLEAVIMSERHQRPAARCFEDIVVFNYKTAQKTPLKGFMVDKLRETYQLQEASKKACEDEVEGIIKAVEEIEASAA